MSFNKVHLWVILGMALLVRLISLGAYPLMDTTEARYGEMARLMVDTGNWLTPQFDYGVPFWGKPPLFTWMSAVGIESFGVNEFAVRAPHWLAGVLVIALMAYFSRRVGFSGLLTSVVLATCGIFAIAAGAVMTDMALTLAMTIAMVGFYFCWQGDRKWGYVGFFGLALGMLAKGPLIIVIMGIAVMPWLIMQHGFVAAFKVLWQRFPIVTGTVGMLAIAVPWYILAEQAAPGFLDYFIVGEHFKRFLVSGWEGDLYGSAHDEVRGTIWLFFFYAAAPWSFVLPVLMWRKRKALGTTIQTRDGIVSFLVCWLVSPLIMFTFSGNILPAYILPGVPALGLLISVLLSDVKRDQVWFKGVASIAPVLLIIAVVFIQLVKGDKKSDKVIFETASTELATYYVGHRPFSGQFYSSGKAKRLDDNVLLANLEHFQLIGEPEIVQDVIAENQLDCVVEYTGGSKRNLYRCGQ